MFNSNGKKMVIYFLIKLNYIKVKYFESSVYCTYIERHFAKAHFQQYAS